jgi:hypothetical protein
LNIISHEGEQETTTTMIGIPKTTTRPREGEQNHEGEGLYFSLEEHVGHDDGEFVMAMVQSANIRSYKL